jgi:hypothetical protein
MSERPFRNAVALRDRASGRYLGAGTIWCDDADGALVLDELEAAAVVRRFACEPEALELVPAQELGAGGSCRAVA